MGDLLKSREYLEAAKNELVSANSALFSIMQIASIYNRMEVEDFSLSLLFKLLPMPFPKTYGKILNISQEASTRKYIVEDGRISEFQNQRNIGESQLSVLDLEEGSLHVKGKEIEALSSKQVLLLKLLIAKNSYGCFDGVLIEKIYPESIYNHFEKDKLKKLTARLKSKGFKIEVRDRYFFLSNISDYSIIFRSNS